MNYNFEIVHRVDVGKFRQVNYIRTITEILMGTLKFVTERQRVLSINAPVGNRVFSVIPSGCWLITGLLQILQVCNVL